MFKNTLIIGLGLIGGSLAAILRQKKITDTISGYDVLEKTRDKALNLGLIDKKVSNLPEAIKDADLIIICSHLTSYTELGKIISQSAGKNTLITDIGSVKSPALNLESLLTKEQKKNFVSSHPIAGSENSGIEASTASLLEKRKIIITPLENSSAKTVQTITKLWQSLGCHVEIMKAGQHDMIYAAVSHVPQFLDYCFADFLAKQKQKIEIKKIEGPNENFSKFVRLAYSSPELWQDIFLANNKNISKVLADFYLNFSNIMREIEAGQTHDLLERFTKVLDLRKALPDYPKYSETSWSSDNFDITCIIPRVIALAFLEVTGDMSYGGRGFLDFTRIIISEPKKNADYLINNKHRILSYLHSYFECMDNFYKIIERNTRPDVFIKMNESRNNYIAAVKRD